MANAESNNPYINLSDDGHEITHTIYDKYDEDYAINGHLSKSGFMGYVYSETMCIGRINWDTSKSDVMIIADLVIFDMEGLLSWRKRVSRFLKKQPTHFKGRGIGSAMLNYIITSAKAMDISEIRGWIDNNDIKETPYLPAFYRKHGFTVNNHDLTFYQVLD